MIEFDVLHLSLSR